MHQGPYDQVKEAYGLLEAWVKDNGYRYAGPAREIYLNDPSQVPEAELLTEVQFPVEKA
jgi:effector-binding domain-containing protein